VTEIYEHGIVLTYRDLLDLNSVFLIIRIRLEIEFGFC